MLENPWNTARQPMDLPSFDDIEPRPNTQRRMEAQEPNIMAVLQDHEQRLVTVQQEVAILNVMLQNNWGEDEYKQHREGAIEQLWPKPKQPDITELESRTEQRINVFAQAIEERIAHSEEQTNAAINRLTDSMNTIAQMLRQEPANTTPKPPQQADEAEEDDDDMPITTSSPGVPDVMDQKQWEAAHKQAGTKPQGGKAGKKK